MNLFENFQVHDILDISSKDICIVSTIPDHRLLTVEFKQSLTPIRNINPKQPVTIKKIPPGYMQGKAVIDELGLLAAQLSLEALPIDLDTIYNSFCKIIDEQLVTKPFKHPKRSQNYNKAWWNEELSALAKKVRCTLKAWEGNKSSSELKLAYLENQRNFSKLVRRSKRKFRRDRQVNLLEKQKSKPKEFWNFVKGIGSDRQELPTLVYGADGSVVNKTEEVLNTWKEYFCNLLNPKSANNVQATTHSIDSLHLDASELSESLSYEEVRRAVFANDDGKSPGFDHIKPLFIKNEACVRFLHPLFNYCLQHGIVPRAWFKTIIKPIPKSNPKSQSPSDYRGISLQSFVAKTYCRILNSRAERVA